MSQKKKITSSLVTVIVAIICLVGVSSSVYASYVMKYFSGTSHYSNERMRTASQIKNDNTPASVKYVSGSSSTLYVELWGSDGTSADAYNFTQVHKINGINRTYYTVPKGCYTTIHNTLYEHYKTSAYASLVFWTYKAETVAGQWSCTTK